MIESLSIKSIATFDEVGVQLSNLKKINFIYGANGCGKTTITKVINNPTDTLYTNCSIVWKNGIQIKALVYNKIFRDKNFGKGTINGVFTLGEATKEEIEAIQKMQEELFEIKEKGIKKKESLTKLSNDKLELENEFKETVWTEIYKEYETDFKEAFIGVLKKESFKTKILEEFNNNKSVLKNYDELKEKSKTVFGKIPTTIPLITVINFDRLIEIEENKIWQKKIIGRADIEIAKLIQKLNLNDWVNEGRTYLQENETCPFCQEQTITKDFKNQLEHYFDESFTTDTGIVKALSEEYHRLASNLSNVLQQIESAEKLNTETKLNIETFSAYLKTVVSQFISNKELLNNKLKEPSRSVDLISVKEQLENIQEIITKANILIKEHNTIVSNYTIEKSDLIKEIWKYITERYSAKISTFNRKADGLQRGIHALQKQHQDLQANYLQKINK